MEAAQDGDDVRIIPVFCTNLKCGFTWRTKNNKRVQKCYRCGASGTRQLEIPVTVKAPNAKSKKQGTNLEEIRQEKLTGLKKRLEADGDEGNFRLSTHERKSLNQKIRHLESDKIYAEYYCHVCCLYWVSVHGWTNFSQRCYYCKQLATCRGQISLSDEEIQAKMNRSARRMTVQPGPSRFIGHDPRRCEMCGIFIRSGHDVNCMKKKWVRLQAEGTTYRIISSY